MSPTPDAAAWAELGEFLQARRKELAPRYARTGGRFAGDGGLTVFARERKVERRVVFDIETAKRQNFGPDTLADLERAYKLPRGTIKDFLAEARAKAEHVDRPHYTDPAEDAYAAGLWKAALEVNQDEEGAVFTPAQIRGFVEMQVLIRRREQSSGTARNSEQRRVAG